MGTLQNVNVNVLYRPSTLITQQQDPTNEKIFKPTTLPTTPLYLTNLLPIFLNRYFYLYVIFIDSYVLNNKLLD
jgi:hypothetical protein